MPDDRYQKFLGIEPAEEIPTYYELFDVAKEERDQAVIDNAYKTQIRKLQEIRTSKDKGFIEYLKEELRKAKRVLSTDDLRKAYDESLIADALSSFKDFVGALMVMGHINKGLYDTMVARGVDSGLAEAQAKSAIEDLAKQHGATLETEEPAPAPAAVAAPARAPEPELDDSEPEFAEDAPPAPPQRGGEIVLKAPPRRPASSAEHARQSSGDYARPEGPRRGTSDFYPRPGADDFADEAQAAPARPRGPWHRGMGEQPPPWGRRTGSQRARRRAPAAATAAAAPRSGPRSKPLEEAIRVFNLGARLAKAAGEVHEKLRLYFPPANGKTTITKTINGITYEKVLDTEQSTLRDTLKKFQGARDKVEKMNGQDADLVRVRSTQNLALIKGYLEEIRQLKMRLLGGLPQHEEIRIWQEFIGSTRSSRVTRTIEE
ncbi:MAG: hypothetical protein AB7N76_30255 [Planctomycetota bacterium]